VWERNDPWGDVNIFSVLNFLSNHYSLPLFGKSLAFAYLASACLNCERQAGIPLARRNSKVFL